MISSMLLPKILTEKFGCENVHTLRTVICGFSIGSNVYLRWDFMMTASVAFGLINGPYSSAQTFLHRRNGNTVSDYKQREHRIHYGCFFWNVHDLFGQYSGVGEPYIILCPEQWRFFG
ncbi:hypothetical protein AVEN_190545-1 [Araneus ventricosus]|uniref:Uncharacterized protein n=1 Tax=Araneus ventricosus TaxID=182803 RepID=A0A4Y2CFJ9_ARAVE|nr:hypothetical protein AVEN_190545-1 [Araneus ventricosus]